MPSTKIDITVTLNGALTDPTSMTWGEAGGDYGIRRMPDKTVAESAGNTITNVGTGEYSETLVDTTSNDRYDYIITMVYDGTTYNYTQNKPIGRDQHHNIALPSTTHYSSEAEVMRIMGAYAINLHTEDQQDPTNMWTEILNDADSTVDMYLNQFYASANLTNNSWVRRRATYLAAAELSSRRGNPQLFANRRNQIYEELMMVKTGQIHLSVPRLGHSGPVMSNYAMQPYHAFPQRVRHFRSTGDNYANKLIALEPYLW